MILLAWLIPAMFWPDLCIGVAVGAVVFNALKGD